MKQQTFYVQLLTVTALCALGAFFIHQQPLFADDAILTWIAIGLFTILSISMYYRGHASALSDNKNDFTNTFLGFLVGKLFLCGGLIIGYYYTVTPDSKLFVLPFFGVYIAYTIFEVLFMSRLGRMST